MEEQEKPTDRLVHSAVETIEAYKDLISLTVVENLTLGISVSIIGILSIIFACFMILFAGLGFAWWIGESMDNMKAGFFIAGGGFLLIVAIIALAARRGIITFIRNIVIKKIYEED